MEILLIIGALLAFIVLVIALAFVGALWFVYLLVIAGLVLIWMVGIGTGILFVVAVFIANLVWQIFKHYQEKRRLENFEELDLLDNESL